MYLRPSEIFFSQDSISNVFDKNCRRPYKPIGETFDALYEGRLSIHAIPPISVKLYGNKWFTADNRRLWVFRNLEPFGKCYHIDVIETDHIPPEKFTTINGGVSVYVRGFIGGRHYKEPLYQIPSQVQENQVEDNVVEKQEEKEDEVVNNGVVEAGDERNIEEEQERKEKENSLSYSEFNNGQQVNTRYFIAAIIVMLIAVAIAVMIYKYI